MKTPKLTKEITVDVFEKITLREPYCCDFGSHGWLHPRRKNECLVYDQHHKIWAILDCYGDVYSFLTLEEALKEFDSEEGHLTWLASKDFWKSDFYFAATLPLPDKQSAGGYPLENQETNIIEKAEELALKGDYDLEILIKCMCQKSELNSIAPFIKRNARLRKTLTYGKKVYHRNEIMPTYEFHYNPNLFPLCIEQRDLDLNGVVQLLLELSRSGYEHLSGNKYHNVWSGLKFDMDKLAEFQM